MPNIHPPRLKRRDDGAFELPLAPVPGDDGKLVAREPVVLPEPNMEQLAAIFDIVADADKNLREHAPLEEVGPELQAKLDRNTLATLRGEATEGEALTAEELTFLRDRRDTLRKRSDFQYSKNSPHGQAVVKIVELLAGTEYELKDFPGWAMHSGVVNELVSGFTDPFVGRDAPESQLGPSPTGTPEG